MLKKPRIHGGEVKSKAQLDKEFNFKLSNIYIKKLSKFNLEKQLQSARGNMPTTQIIL